MNRVRVASRSGKVVGTLRVPTRHTECVSYGGFTLVELLVVIVVMLILITMTVSAVDFAFTQERVKAAARQVQSALAGARDRAIYAGKKAAEGAGNKKPKPVSRGVRLLTDETDPRLITAMIYVGTDDDFEPQGAVSIEYVDDNNDGVPDLVIDTNNDGILEKAAKIVRGHGCNWFTLKERGALGLFEDKNFNGVLDPGEDQNGNGLLDLDAPRIEIPAGTNHWYPVLTYRLSATREELELVTPYSGPESGLGTMPYNLELQPRVLKDAQPIVLPEGVCIDLDASWVPTAWRPGPGLGVNGPYSSHMDIMFSPRGVVTGPLAAEGFIHLYVAERKDVQNTITLLGRQWTNSSPNARRSWAWIPAENQFREDTNENGVLDTGEDLNGNGQLDEAAPLGQRAIVSIFTQTGKVASYQIDAFDPEDRNGNGTLDPGEDTNGNGMLDGNDGFASDPFRNVHSEVTNP